MIKFSIKRIQARARTKARKSEFIKSFLGICIAILLGLFAFCFVYLYLEASLKVSILLALIAIFITLWTNKALPIGVVSLLPIILFPSFGILDTKEATSNYANPIVFLFLGGFMIAAATEKIGLHRLIAKIFLSKFPKTPEGILYALGFASILLGAALSNSTVALLLLPVAMSISKDKVLKTRFLLALAFSASIGGITTPISSPPNLIYLGFLESINLPGISFTTWIFMMLPLVFIMLFAMVKILSIGLEKKELDLSFFEEVQMTKEHKRLLFFLASLLFLLLINSPIKPFYNGLGLNENLILLAFGLLMFVPKIGFLEWNDSKAIPYELIFLFGASFCIAMAFSQAELGGAFVKFFALFSELPFVFFAFIACVCAIIATSLLSTTALIAIILPIINVATASFLDDTYRMLSMLLLTICASFCFMIPISTPPNAIVFNQGGVRAVDMLKFGFLLSVVGILLLSLFGIWYWWLFL